ncbi:bacillithiol biosynthesis cysteine-adding enzyme BshC [Bacillus solimangrovi]|uniref:Putative cysteine ligase BshC n=1 Tax=Bacillus solimangrovi TaxID=1305675 RepID=A0A1E5LIN3_9BACI|nr:bacillithiol biosynthesis cysteine-adding enzyme BshC [Bacillus solimangrovi]OEH93942.1 bacillithiol biosynthesis cysteine-adding enzyme BshC [Bacillus solimangrovi]
MEIKQCSLPPTNPFVLDYINQQDKALKYFDYNPQQHEAFTERVEELSKRTFKREQLADYLYSYNRNIGCSEKTLQQIEKLKNENAVTVVAGQQAGIVTGPLYTIHKAISIIQFSRKKEQELGIPVVPIFWTAGEDHDFAEINHIFAPAHEHELKKYVSQEDDNQKLPIADRVYDKRLMSNWVEDIIRHFGETIHTSDVVDKLKSYIETSQTYTEFFNRLMLALFGDSGLVVLDSNDADLRNLESSFFKQLIQNNGKLQHQLLTQQLTLKEDGYGEPIIIQEQNTHLFYHNNSERILLERLETGDFLGKGALLRFSEAELMQIASDYPERLSNNVVTRPLMQDYLFPVLAFFGGPGEIAYWATLKPVFHQFGFKVPPVVPRLNITIVERNIASWIEELELEVEELLKSGANHHKEARLEKVERKDIDEQVKGVSKQIDDLHQSLRMLAADVDPNLTELAYKNGSLIQTQLQYLHKQMDRSLREQKSPLLRKYEMIDVSFKPFGSPQERIWNILYFLNGYGMHFVSELNELSYSFNNRHNLVFL